ncbi:NAD(P)H-binding protein [Rhodohalobacter sp. 8-1]|uniref:NAD(P)H-binding protein n=1 Tax=Rhodohalobacter sp. 8-1 TaxID=3131972 RepID=UPI0030EC2F22
MNKKTAVVLGATGLVGSHVINLLLDDARYSTVKVFHRRSTGIKHDRLEEQVIDFDDIESWKNQLTGDELYSAMGTTIKKAGSKEAQFKIDVTYPLEAAKAAAANGVKKYSLVSSAGADKESRLFYPRIKGELDDAVSGLSFDRITIMRPSILDGEREESRPGERFGLAAMRIAGKIPGLKKYRPILAEQVARAMINSLQDDAGGCFIFEPNEVFHL